MPSLIQKPSGIWYFVFHHNHKQRWKSLRTRDKAVAKQLFNRLQVQVDQARHGLTPKKYKFSDAADLYLDRKKVDLKPKTFEQYSRQVGTVKRLLIIDYVHRLDLQAISDFIKSRQAEGVAGKTIKEELATIKAILKFAHYSKLISEIPLIEWPKIKTIPVAPDTLDFYSLDEIEKLKARIKGRPFEPVFLFALYTGCRLQEIKKLKIKDINLSEGIIRIRNNKTESNAKNQIRRIPIHPQLSEFLKSYLAGRSANEPFSPLLARNQDVYASKTLHRHCNAAGVPYKRFHGLRHTAATYLLANGVDLATVMQLMGWTRLETAKRYIHMAATAKTAMAKLPY